MNIKNALKIKNSGFSLVELLIVMAMIGVIATTTVAMFTRFNQQQNITIAANNLRTHLAEAKSNATSHVDALRCSQMVPPQIVDGYRLTYFPSAQNNEYILEEICHLPGGAEVYRNVRTIPPTTKKLPQGITFSPGGFTSIRFNTLSRPAPSSGSITIQNSSGQTITISVSTQGVIQ